MRKFRLFAATGLSSALLLSVAAPAFAQDARAAQASTGDNGADIIVTARRSEERLQDVPISITVLSQTAIAEHNIVNSADLGTFVPSLATNSNFGPEKSSFAIRGFTQEGKTSPSVGVYFADVVEPRSNGGTTSGNGVGVGELFDLQNVEVLKGPQGTLFGRNTTGGNVLIVPQKPTDKLGGYIEGTVGGYNEHRIQAVLNVPLSDTIRVRGGIDWNQADGYVKNVSGVGPSNFDNTNYVSARLSVVADLTPDLENYTIGTFSRSRTNGDVPKMLGCDPTGTINPLGPLACLQVIRDTAANSNFWSVDNNDPNPFELQKQWRVINTTTWKSSDTLTVKNIISYAQFKEAADFSLEGDNLLLPPTFTTLATKTILLEPGFSNWNSQQSTFTEELQFQGKLLNGRLNWQAGGYLEISKPLGFNGGLTDIFINCTDIRNFICTGAGTISDSQTKTSFNNKGLYAQATYKLDDKFSLTGGFRYTMDRVTDENQDVTIVVPTPGTGILFCHNPLVFNNGAGGLLQVTSSAQCDNVFKVGSNRPTWLIDLDYKPSSDVLLYAKYSRGYRQGGINSNNLGIETWGPEKVDAYEVGAKTSFRGTMPGYFNFAGFYNDFTGQQLSVSAYPNATYSKLIGPAQGIINAGKSRIWGFEVDASVRPFAGFKLDVGYTYLNTRLIDVVLPPPNAIYLPFTSGESKGGPLSLSPKNRITLTGTYTLPLDSSIGKISFGATFTHTDANRAVADTSSPVVASLGGFGGSPGFAVLSASNLLNLNASWNSVFGQPFDLSFFMTNVTNEQRLTFPSQSLPVTGGDGGHLNQPRMWGFRLKVRFGG